jgi:hypothetical protein
MTVIGNTGGAKEVIVVCSLLELAVTMLLIDGAAAPPNAASIAEMVSSGSSGGRQAGVTLDTAGSTVTLGLNIMPIPTNGPFAASCLASMCLWMWFWCDLPWWRA